jgi:hypothetical protein
MHSICFSLESFVNLFIVVCASLWFFHLLLYFELLEKVPKESNHRLVK